MRWTKAMIRSKIEYFDTITGLNGSELPIRFNQSGDALGHFGGLHGREAGFTFSRLYFHSPYFSKRMAHETIAHEYAHYMSHVRGESPGHGEAWRTCCRKIGLMNPRQWYFDRVNAEYLEEERGDAARREERDRRCEALAQYRPGMQIEHPSFGEGVLTETSDTQDGARMTIRFACGTKTLNARWVFAYCKLIREKE